MSTRDYKPCLKKTSIFTNYDTLEKKVSICYCNLYLKISYNQHVQLNSLVV
jgi:hypothetical protein